MPFIRILIGGRSGAPRGARRRARCAARLTTLAVLAGCSLDVTNPNAATEEEVLTTPAGMRAVAIGLQARFGNSIEHAVWVPGIVSGELGNTDASQSTSREFQKYPVPSANTPRIETNNPDLLNFWARQYAVVRSANDILGNVDAVTMAPGTKSGLTALAKAFKAIALGTLIEAWELVPLDPAQENPVFSDRATVLAEVLDLLASARADLAATPPSSEFTTQILLPGIDLTNIIIGMQARYSLVAGQWNEAFDFTTQLTSLVSPEYRYSTVDQNPLWATIQSLRYFAAIATFRTNAEAGDARVNRYTGTTVTTPFGGAQVIPIAIYTTNFAAVPIYRLDEITLIRAEARARVNRLADAIAEVNVVRQANDLPPIDPNAPTTQQAVLDEIYRQRTYSLFLTGLHWADQRRFGRIDDARVPWLPYPAQETAGNPNAPTGP